MYKQTNTILKTKRIRSFALIINCRIILKKNSWFSQNVYAISNRIWCNKHLRHTTKEKYDNNGKGGYFWFDDENDIDGSVQERRNSSALAMELRLSCIYTFIYWLIQCRTILFSRASHKIVMQMMIVFFHCILFVYDNGSSCRHGNGMDLSNLLSSKTRT